MRRRAWGRPPKPVADEYVPKEPSGRYWIGRGEDGRPKIYFDGPERAASGGPEEASGAGKPDGDTSEGTKGLEKWRKSIRNFDIITAESLLRGNASWAGRDGSG